MGSTKFVDAIIEKKLRDLHCGYIAKVVWTDGQTATVQPLGLIKDAGSGETKVQAVVSNVPVACRYKFSRKTINYTKADGTTDTQAVAVPSEISKGDLVACLCADRDISASRRGDNEVPPAGRHSISDSIIVGIL